MEQPIIVYVSKGVLKSGPDVRIIAVSCDADTATKALMGVAGALEQAWVEWYELDERPRDWQTHMLHRYHVRDVDIPSLLFRKPPITYSIQGDEVYVTYLDRPDHAYPHLGRFGVYSELDGAQHAVETAARDIEDGFDGPAVFKILKTRVGHMISVTEAVPSHMRCYLQDVPPYRPQSGYYITRAHLVSADMNIRGDVGAVNAAMERSQPVGQAW